MMASWNRLTKGSLLFAICQGVETNTKNNYLLRANRQYSHSLDAFLAFDKLGDYLFFSVLPQLRRWDRPLLIKMPPSRRLRPPWTWHLYSTQAAFLIPSKGDLDCQGTTKLALHQFDAVKDGLVTDLGQYLDLEKFLVICLADFRNDRDKRSSFILSGSFFVGKHFFWIRSTWRSKYTLIIFYLSLLNSKSLRQRFTHRQWPFRWLICMSSC